MKLYKHFPSLLAAIIVGSLGVMGISAETTDVTDTVEISIEDTTETQIQTYINDNLQDNITEEYNLQSDITSVLGTDEVILPTEEECELKFGWVSSDNGSIYYFINGVTCKGLCEIDGNTYYFAPNGVMKTGWQTIDNIRIFFDPETGAKTTGWIDYMDYRYYAHEELGKLNGVQNIDGETYIFDEKGILYTDWFEYSGDKYYSGNNGAIRKGTCEIDGVTYVFSDFGKFQSGWQTVNNIRTFYNYQTSKPVYGWIIIMVIFIILILKVENMPEILQLIA